MVIFAIVAMIVLLVWAAYLWWDERGQNYKDNFFMLPLCVAALIGAIWAINAHAYSRYEKDSCQEKAEGYGLKESDWSHQTSCRVKLPNGSLVDIDSLRINEDGEIFAGGQ